LTEEIRLHLDRAGECLTDAKVLVANERFAAATARAYYAMYHAATAALLSEGIERSSHSGTISAFGQFLVKEGRVGPRFHEYFREAFDLRQESDYQPVTRIGAEEARDAVERGEEFTRVCEDLCK